jgi:regulator of PEP synthase PpsR (kinase-PPPase family)
MQARRPVFYVSDGTGITAETIGHSVLTQFEGITFDTQRIPFVDSYDKAHHAANRIHNAGQRAGRAALS